MWQALRNRFILLKIINTLRRDDSIRIEKAKPYSNIRYFRYKITANFSDFSRKTIRGYGGSAHDSEALLKAWGEFVERYSYHAVCQISGERMTSSGFAAHTSIYLAKENAVRELIERDLFLSSWLLMLPIQTMDENHLTSLITKKEREIVNKIKKLNFSIEIGVIGKCMGRFVSIVWLTSEKYSGVFTSCSTDLEATFSNLIRECVGRIEGWLTPVPHLKRDALPEMATPKDHLELYQFSGPSFKDNWIRSHGEYFTEYPEFDITFIKHENWLAKKTNYHVIQAISNECQNLFFGTTTPALVNIERLSKISKRPVFFETLNLKDHPYT